MVCHGGLGKQDGQPSFEDVGVELIGHLVLKRGKLSDFNFRGDKRRCLCGDF